LGDREIVALAGLIVQQRHCTGRAKRAQRLLNRGVGEAVGCLRDVVQLPGLVHGLLGVLPLAVPGGVRVGDPSPADVVLAASAPDLAERAGVAAPETAEAAVGSDTFVARGAVDVAGRLRVRVAAPGASGPGITAAPAAAGHAAAAAAGHA